jgi:hypothetical protein
MEKISYKNLKLKGDFWDGSVDGIKWFQEKFGDSEYTISEFAEKIKLEKSLSIDALIYIMNNCKFLQTQEMLNLIMDMNPTESDIFRLIVNCTIAHG